MYDDDNITPLLALIVQIMFCCICPLLLFLWLFR